MIDNPCVYVGVSGLLLASFGFGASVVCYLCNAPNSSIYEWLAHWPIVIGALMYLSWFAFIDPAFFHTIPKMMDWLPLAFLLGGFAVWGCVRTGL